VILLDTVVVSELRKARPNPRVIEWMRGLRESDVFLSVVTIGEIERGISKVRDAEFAQALTRWLEDLLRFYGDRVLPVTPDIARRWGRLSSPPAPLPLRPRWARSARRSRWRPISMCCRC